MINLTEQLLTANRAAELLGVQPETLRTWARQGRVRSIKMGTAVRFTYVDIMALLSPRSDRGEQ
jgi:excisionase family DNA binding protein